MVAFFRFYAELNDFLPAERAFQEAAHEFPEGATVKDRIEALGVPHTEVDLVLANGEPVDFSYRIQPGDRISVYPVFEALDIGGTTRVRPEPLRDPRFVLDIHLGKLAAYLRMIGFDTCYRNCSTDEQLARISSQEGRILLTRDVGLLKRGAVTHGYFVRETGPRLQLREIVRRFDLARLVRPFTRCMACNGVLKTVAKEEIAEKLPPRTAEIYSEFRQCEQCRRVYWKGGHYQRMRQWVEAGDLY